MKVILYMAMTVNGFIATEDDATPWSDEEWESYNQLVKRTRNLIIGRKTYELMTDEDSKALQNPTTIVLSSQAITLRENCILVQTPRQAIDMLTSKGFSTLLVGGGGKVNQAFLNEGLIDEIYLDIEPIIFGQGVPLFSESKSHHALTLLETKKLSNNLIQLHYKVLK